MPVTKESWLTSKKKPNEEIYDLRMIKPNDVLMVRIDPEPEAVTLFNNDMQKKAIVPIGKKYQVLEPS